MADKSTQKSSGGAVKTGGGKVIIGEYRPKPGATNVKPTPPPKHSADK